MTQLAKTAHHTVEYESGCLWITRHSDGGTLCLTGKRVASEFRACLTTHTAERVIKTYTRLAEGLGCEWHKLYKPGTFTAQEGLF